MAAIQPQKRSLAEIKAKLSDHNLSADDLQALKEGTYEHGTVAQAYGGFVPNLIKNIGNLGSMIAAPFMIPWKSYQKKKYAKGEEARREDWEKQRQEFEANQEAKAAEFVKQKAAVMLKQGDLGPVERERLEQVVSGEVKLDDLIYRTEDIFDVFS